MDRHADDYAPGEWLSVDFGDHGEKPSGPPADAEVLAECVLRDLVRARDDLDELGNEEVAELIQLALEKLDPPKTSHRQLKLAIGG